MPIFNILRTSQLLHMVLCHVHAQSTSSIHYAYTTHICIGVSKISVDYMNCVSNIPYELCGTCSALPQLQVRHGKNIQRELNYIVS